MRDHAGHTEIGKGRQEAESWHPGRLSALRPGINSQDNKRKNNWCAAGPAPKQQQPPTQLCPLTASTLGVHLLLLEMQTLTIRWTVVPTVWAYRGGQREQGCLTTWRHPENLHPQ